jgi:hypothetical protein
MLREKQEFIKAEVAGKDNGSPVGSQSGIMCSSDNSPSASQEKFATQVPCSRVTDFSHLKPVKSNGISGHGSLDDQLAQTLASRSVVNKLKGSSHSAPRISNKCSSTSKDKKLASQLHPSDVPPKGISKKVNNQSNQPINATELLALLPANQASKLSRRAKLDASPGLLVGLRNGENGTSKATPTTRLEMDEQSFKAETRSQSNEKSLETQSITTLTTAGVETSGKSIGEIDVSISATSKREVGLVSFNGHSPGSLDCLCKLTITSFLRGLAVERSQYRKPSRCYLILQIVSTTIIEIQFPGAILRLEAFSNL